MSNELLLTKLSPPRLQGALIDRPALRARLDAGLGRALTLISGPPGFGKTTLVAEWLRSMTADGGRRTAHTWVSLDPGDNDPVRFWRYVLTACRAFDPEAGKAPLAMLNTAQQPPPLEAVLTTFINELAVLPERHILVLEDYHVISSPQIHQALTFLIEHQPATLHLVLIARTEPPLPLARLRARNELNELSAADLRFARDEIAAFVDEALGISLAPADINSLAERTEGWAAGLRLMALAMQGRAPNSGVPAFSGGHRHLSEYFAAEVLNGQDDATQAFLLETCFLARLTGALADAVTGRTGGAQLLAQLEQANLYVVPLSANDGRTWYRYHGLFAEALQHRARIRLGEDRIRALHARAAEWFAAQRLLSEAIEAALRAKEFEPAATLVEQYLDERGLSELQTTNRWAEALPRAVLYAHPFFCLNYAMAILWSSDIYAPATARRMEPPLHAAEEASRADGNDPLLGKIYALRALVAYWQGDLADAFGQAREALELLAEDDVFWRGTATVCAGTAEMLNGNLNTAQRMLIEGRALCEAAQNVHAALAATLLLSDAAALQGEFEQARETYQQVMAQAVGDEGMLDDQSYALVGLAGIAYERNELGEAEQYATRALELGLRRSNEDMQVRASLLLARVQQARGEQAHAVQRLQALAARTHRDWLLREVRNAQARLWLAAGDLDSAQQWQENLAAADPVPGALEEREALTRARLRLALGDTKGALNILDVWRIAARGEGRTRSEVEILILRALVAAAQKDTATVEQALGRALTIGSTHGLRRVFLDEGEPLAALLQAVIPTLKKRPLAVYAAGLLRDLSPQHPSQAGKAGAALPALVEPLSAQEQRVLRLLAAGLSNPEIARELVVSPNTIKTQVKSIFRKLDVSNREDAGTAAREMGLV